MAVFALLAGCLQASITCHTYFCKCCINCCCTSQATHFCKFGGSWYIHLMQVALCSSESSTYLPQRCGAQAYLTPGHTSCQGGPRSHFLRCTRKCEGCWLLHVGACGIPNSKQDQQASLLAKLLLPLRFCSHVVSKGDWDGSAVQQLLDGSINGTPALPYPAVAEHDTQHQRVSCTDRGRPASDSFFDAGARLCRLGRAYRGLGPALECVRQAKKGALSHYPWRT